MKNNTKNNAKNNVLTMVNNNETKAKKQPAAFIKQSGAAPAGNTTKFEIPGCDGAVVEFDNDVISGKERDAIMRELQPNRLGWWLNRVKRQDEPAAENTALSIAEKVQDFDFSTVISEEETTELIEGLLMDAQYHPYAVYGLMFVFASFIKLQESGNAFQIHDLCSRANGFLYQSSFNAGAAIERLSKNLHTAYRAADFTLDNHFEMSQVFVDAETPFQTSPEETDEPTGTKERNDRQEQALEETDEFATDTGDLQALASHISAVMKNPLIPTRLFNAMADELSTVPEDWRTPEAILTNLQDLTEEEEESEQKLAA